MTSTMPDTPRGSDGPTEPEFEAAAREDGVSVDATEAAYGIVVLLDGLWSSLTTGKDDSSIERAIKICDLYIDNTLATGK